MGYYYLVIQYIMWYITMPFKELLPLTTCNLTLLIVVAKNIAITKSLINNLTHHNYCEKR